MTLKSLTFRPGVSRESTNYANEGGFYASDKVRFRSGFPEKIGGWTPATKDTYLDVARTMLTWSSRVGNTYKAIGTNKKLYVLFNSKLYNITPLREPQFLPENPLTFVAGSRLVTVNAPNHGFPAGSVLTAQPFISGDYGYITGAVPDPLFGIPLTEINDSPDSLVDNPGHRFTVINANTLVFETQTSATSSGSGGGSNVVLTLEVNAGPPNVVTGSGWGIGTWGTGTWGTPRDSEGGAGRNLDTLGFWSIDNYGQNLGANPRYGEIYYWDVAVTTDVNGTPIARATLLSALPDAHAVPTNTQLGFISDQLQVVALGTTPYPDEAYDPMLVRWSDSVNPANWEPGDLSGTLTDAGGVRLAYGSKIVGYVETRQETLIFTDTALYSMQYLGPPYTYGFTPISTSTSAISPFAAVSVNNITYWMGDGKFFTYSGTLETLPCSLRQYVFSDFNYKQKEQVTCGGNPDFNEVWWFYCSEKAQYPDRYVVYNYLERIWYYGQLQRTVWTGATGSEYPMACQGGQIFFHEYGNDDGSTYPPSALPAFIQSADFDLDDGFQFMFVKRLIPDITFNGSSTQTPTVDFTLYARNFPGSLYDQETDEPITKKETLGIEQYTEQKWLRLRGRQIAIRISSTELGVAWQLGIPRIDAQPDGRR